MTDDAHDDGPQVCPACDGHCWIEGVAQGCCGNVTSGGECRSHCVIPIQTQEPCGYCGGTGEVA